MVAGIVHSGENPEETGIIVRFVGNAQMIMSLDGTKRLHRTPIALFQTMTELKYAIDMVAGYFGKKLPDEDEDYRGIWNHVCTSLGRSFVLKEAIEKTFEIGGVRIIAYASLLQ